MSNTPNTTNLIELKIEDISQDLVYAGRTEKEIKENAKELAPMMQAFGGWDQAQPGVVFFDENNKPHLLAGFTRCTAAGMTEPPIAKGWFFVDDKSDETARRLKFITTNAGKSISRYNQGKTYGVLLNGTVADDFKGSVADPEKAEDWKYPPLSLGTIAERVGKTKEHVRQCILIHDSPEAIRELLEDGKVSAGVVVTASQWAKGDDKLSLKLIKAAVAQARSEDKECATDKHLRTIKAEVIPAKAVTPADAKGKETSSTGGESTQQPELQSGGQGDKSETGSSTGGESTQQPELQSGGNTPEQKNTKKEDKRHADKMREVIAKWNDGASSPLTDKDVDGIISALIAAGFTTSTPF